LFEVGSNLLLRYVALVRGARYQGLVERTIVERQVLKQLLARGGR